MVTFKSNSRVTIVHTNTKKQIQHIQLVENQAPEMNCIAKVKIYLIEQINLKWSLKLYDL